MAALAAPTSESGAWRAIHQYFNRLSKAGFSGFLQDRMITGDASEAVFMDSTHRRIRQQATGPEPPKDKAIGTPRGDLNTKIRIVVDAFGRLAAPMKPVATGENPRPGPRIPRFRVQAD